MRRRKYKVEKVKKGRRLYGEIRTFPDGRSCFIAFRKHADIWRGAQHKTISEAMRAGVAAWGFYDDTITMLRRREIEVIGVKVKETGDLYLTRMDVLMDKGTVRFNERSNTLQRFLPLRWFVVRRNKISL